MGFIRVSANRRVIPTATSPATAIDVLTALCALEGHHFWADDSALRATDLDLDRLGSHRQVTDVHLVGLAAERGGVLATFDHGVAEALAPSDRDFVQLLDAAVR